MSHRTTHRASETGAQGATRPAARTWAGASWLVLACLACADGDATPAYSYPFEPNVEMPPPSTVNVVTNVSPNQPDDGLSDRSDVEGASPAGDLDATGGVGGISGVGGTGVGGVAGMAGTAGVGGVGGSPGLGLGGEGGFNGFTPADPADIDPADIDPADIDPADTAGFGGGGFGGEAGTGGAAGSPP